MAKVSQRTLTHFAKVMSGFVLREIDDVFEAEGLQLRTGRHGRAGTGFVVTPPMVELYFKVPYRLEMVAESELRTSAKLPSFGPSPDSPASCHVIFAST